MDIQTAKQIKIADYLHSLGFSPVKQQGINLWYKSPLREETEASFKVNTERNQWYDFALGKGGNIIALAQELYCSDQCALPLAKNRRTDTPYSPRVFFFWQAIIFRAKFSTTGDCTAFFSCPACLFAGKGNKHCNGEKRMQ